jgi:hypothetical protein
VLVDIGRPLFHRVLIFPRRLPAGGEKKIKMGGGLNTLKRCRHFDGENFITVVYRLFGYAPNGGKLGVTHNYS